MKGKKISKEGLIILGGILGIFSIFSYYLSPVIGNWWYFSWNMFKGEYNVYINAFGYDTERSILKSRVINNGLLFLLGSMLAVLFGTKKWKSLSLIPSLIMFFSLYSYLTLIYMSNNIIKVGNSFGIENLQGFKAFTGYSEESRWGLGVGFYLGFFASSIVFMVSVKHLIKKIKLKRLSKKVSKILEKSNLAVKNQGLKPTTEKLIAH